MLVVQAHPGLFGAGAPWLTGAAYKDVLAHFANTAVACTYVRDKGEGEITIDKDGWPRVHYKISPYDQKSMWKVCVLQPAHTCYLDSTSECSTAVRLCAEPHMLSE